MTVIDSESLGRRPEGTNAQAKPVARNSLPSASSLLPYLLPVAVAATWQVLSSLGVISTRMMPSPADVLAGLPVGGVAKEEIGS